MQRVYLEVVLDCAVSQITADGEARAAVLAGAAGPCSLRAVPGSPAAVLVILLLMTACMTAVTAHLVSPLTPAPVAAVRAVGGAV